MEIIKSLSPKPLKPYVRATQETKMFYAVSDFLHRVGIHGDDNTIETCRVLGINDCGYEKQLHKKQKHDTITPATSTQ